MPFYETTVITRQDLSRQDITKLTDGLTAIVEQGGGKVVKNEYWGLRNLAYPIRKSRKAHYSLVNIEGPGEVIHELERRHRINEDVLRYLTVRVDTLTDEPSPVIARKDRDDRSKRRRDEEGGFGGDRQDRPERSGRDDRGPRGGRDRDR